MIDIELDITNLKDNNLFNKTKDILNFISNFIQNKTNSTQSFVIDRFEENFAVCQNFKTKEMINIPISKLPKNIKESDIITLNDNVLYIDNKKTESRKDYIEDLTKDLFENN